VEVWCHAFLTSASCPSHFTPRKEPLRLGRPQSQSGCGEEKNSQSLLGIEPPNPDHPDCSQLLYKLDPWLKI